MVHNYKEGHDQNTQKEDLEDSQFHCHRYKIPLAFYCAYRVQIACSFESKRHLYNIDHFLALQKDEAMD